MIHSIVFMKMVPDVVEELEIEADGKALDTQWLRMIPSEPCEHALEQALLLKEKYGGEVTVLALDAAELDDALFTATAKGADRVIKLVGGVEGIQSPTEAELLAQYVEENQLAESNTLLLTASQSIDDLQGELGPRLADKLTLPFIGVITAIEIDEAKGTSVVTKEFAGGLRGKFEVVLPAVLGIQAAEKPPRYVPVAKVMNAMKTAQIEEAEAVLPEKSNGFTIDKMFKPEQSGRAEMLEGSPEDITKRIADILQEKGLI
jgi:electron transfer flavoprotein beta subunit